eukprot:11011819-Heterocapsa_arctica.AAC.1
MQRDMQTNKQAPPRSAQSVHQGRPQVSEREPANAEREAHKDRDTQGERQVTLANGSTLT